MKTERARLLRKEAPEGAVKRKTRSLACGGEKTNNCAERLRRNRGGTKRQRAETETAHQATKTLKPRFTTSYAASENYCGAAQLCCTEPHTAGRWKRPLLVLNQQRELPHAQLQLRHCTRTPALLRCNATLALRWQLAERKERKTILKKKRMKTLEERKDLFMRLHDGNSTDL